MNRFPNLHRRGARTARVAAVLLGASVAGLLPASAGAQQVALQPDWDRAIMRSRMAIDEIRLEKSIPGLSIAVSVDGRRVWSQGMGWADLEAQVPATPRTVYRIGSVSKILTASLAALLHQRGQLDLDAPVQTYVPSFPEKPEGEITTRLLAGHLGGLRHYQDIEAEYFITRPYATTLESLELFADDPLVATPGERFSYSSYGFNLMSAVIAAAGGRPFLEQARTELFEPFRMLSTGGDLPHVLIRDRARPYDRGEDGDIVNARYVDNSHKWAGGGFVSTAEDLLRFARGHMAAGVFDQETIDLMWTPQRTSSGEEIGSGIGWRIFPPEAAGGRRLVGHAGAAIGGSALLLIYPDDGLAIAIAANIADVDYPFGGELVFGDAVFEAARYFLQEIDRGSP